MKEAGTYSKSCHSLKSAMQGLQLLLIQSMVCIIALLLALILKTLGGTAYENAVDRFQEGLYEHHLLDVSEATALTTLPVTTQTTTSTAVVNAVSVIASSFKMVHAPLKGGIITSNFGIRTDPITGDPSGNHHGVDIAAPEGTRLNALVDGTVVETGYEENGYGWYVIVECTPQYRYLYAHCRQLLVENGQTVAGGDTIALVGSTGKSTGSHLHFEWRENGKAVDPMKILPKETYA